LASLLDFSESEHGAVAEDLVGDFNLMDIIEIHVEEFCPNGYQCENATFKPTSIKKIGKLRLSAKNLDKLIDMEQRYLFGNRGKAVSDAVIDSVGHEQKNKDNCRETDSAWRSLAVKNSRLR